MATSAGVLKFESTFKRSKTIEARLALSNAAKQDNPDRVPVVIERNPDCKLPVFDCKMFVSKFYSVATLVNHLRKQFSLPAHQSLFLFVEGKVVLTSTMTFNDIYTKYKDPDGFLYISYTDVDAQG